MHGLKPSKLVNPGGHSARLNKEKVFILYKAAKLLRDWLSGGG